ncbi:hypothetical protein LT40_08735 [Pseudomonas rhizosphaerae]|uniref:Uncharacterized protein n=1 Tax=Pseudomonas rhizosphaerae TaxID=216142 RepID=A0A089ZQE3_9PSED|nr:hypothetical protein [Pseudomonas rhizosphaerae]AIS17481.1 hypothetical protein LT40_08735 [Pseudomonas rhizosphaerae]
MFSPVENVTAIEQATVALLTELHMSGGDLVLSADFAKRGIKSGAAYSWVGPELVAGSQDAVDRIVEAITLAS